MPGGRNAGSDRRLFSKTAARMYAEGRADEYEELRRECRGGEIRGWRLKNLAEKRFPPMGEVELAERRAAGLAPSAEEVQELLERRENERVREASVAGTKLEARAHRKELEAGGLNRHKRSEFRSAEQQLSVLKEVEWVKNNLVVADVKPEDAPSPGAWAMLVSYRASPGTARFFFEKIVSATMPRRQEIEAQERFKDDGRKLDDMADGVKKMADLAVERAREQWERLEAQARGKA